ncbi:MAG: ribosome biogenesis GTPase YlqF [Proteobacteria bacterium]|nr:ribosome biogenesis GTPase YlqF [Pseudomonadota bacterium]
MTIQWYPGHMKKAKDEISEAIARIDVIIEMLDGRLPASSRNPVLDELRQKKPCIRLLNKRDLADPLTTSLWIREFEKYPAIRALDIEAHDLSLVKILPDLCRQLVTIPLKRPIRAMVVGIPNVGKSTLINTLAGRKLAKVGNQPAITRHQQLVQIPYGTGTMDISDTPGILWPNLEDRKGAYRLAASGAIRDTAMDYEDVAMFAGEYLRRSYPDALISRFNLNELPETAALLLEAIGRKRGCLLKGGRIDMHKAAEILIHDLRSGKIGRISFEKPQDLEPQITPTTEV